MCWIIIGMLSILTYFILWILCRSKCPICKEKDSVNECEQLSHCFKCEKYFVMKW
jgi:hypothetical protein